MTNDSAPKDLSSITDEDAAAIGRDLMDRLPSGYHYNDSPAEIVTDLQNELFDLKAQLATMATFAHWMWHALDDFAGENAQTGECNVEFPADDWKRCNELLDAIGEDPHETLHTVLEIGDE